MRYLILAALLVVVPASAQQFGGEESVFRQAAEAAKAAKAAKVRPRAPAPRTARSTTTPAQTTNRSRSTNPYIGPLVYDGVAGALINNEGDSVVAKERIAMKKEYIAAETAAGYYNPPKEYTLHGQPVASTAERNNEWYSDSFYSRHESANRVRLDAWTFQRGFRFNAFVLSCVYDRESQKGGQLKFFIRGLEPIGTLGSDTKVVLRVKGSKKGTFRLSGTVSHVRSTNIHIDIDDQALINRMRDSREFTVEVQSVANPRPTIMTFSLMGFTAATTNTVANCMEGVQ